MGERSEISNALDVIGDMRPLKASEEIDARGRVKNLLPWHLKAINEHIVENKAPDQIALENNVTPNHVKLILSSNLARDYIKNELLNKLDLSVIRLRVKNLSDKAINVLDKILTGSAKTPEEKALQARVAMDILNRTGINEPKEHKISMEHIFKSFASQAEDVYNKIMEEEAEDAEIEEDKPNLLPPPETSERK
jgi:hypothetical protein